MILFHGSPEFSCWDVVHLSMPTVKLPAKWSEIE